MAPKELGTQQKYRFRFEAENRFCLMGYGATVAMLFLVYQFEIELIRLQDFLTYALLTLGFHSFVQVVGQLGYLDSKRRNVVVSQIAMLNWGASFVLACFMVSELRPILLLGSFLTLNFYVGRGDFRQSIGLSILISCFYMSPALVSEFGDESYAWWTRDSIYLFAFLVIAGGTMVSVLQSTPDQCVSTTDGDLSEQSTFGQYQGIIQSGCGSNLALDYIIGQGTSVSWSGFEGAITGSVAVNTGANLEITGNANFESSLTNAGSLAVKPQSAPSAPAAPADAAPARPPQQRPLGTPTPLRGPPGRRAPPAPAPVLHPACPRRKRRAPPSASPRRHSGRPAPLPPILERPAADARPESRA